MEKKLSAQQQAMLAMLKRPKITTVEEFLEIGYSSKRSAVQSRIQKLRNKGFTSITAIHSVGYYMPEYYTPTPIERLTPQQRRIFEELFKADRSNSYLKSLMGTSAATISVQVSILSERIKPDFTIEYLPNGYHLVPNGYHLVQHKKVHYPLPIVPQVSTGQVWDNGNIQVEIVDISQGDVLFFALTGTFHKFRQFRLSKEVFLETYQLMDVERNAA